MRCRADLTNKIPLMCVSSDQEKLQSKRLDKWIKQMNKIYKSTIKLLLLGTGESGKSTILKQMRIIHASKFTDAEKREKLYDIKSNIRDSILSILEAMERLKIKLDDPTLNDLREYIFENIHLFLLNSSYMPTIDQANKNNDCKHSSKVNQVIQENSIIHAAAEKTNYEFIGSDDTPGQLDLAEKIEKLWMCIERLWRDGGVKKCAKHGNEYHLIDSAEYFLDRIHLIKQSSYLPNEQDILRCRVLTSGISENRFSVKSVNFHVFDVGGQRDQRRKWIQCFNKVTAIIYVVDISSFNMTLREDNNVNRLKESLHSFRQIWINRYLYNISIILFLNKYDLFVKKILEENIHLEDFFPDYAHYQRPSHIEKHLRTAGENAEITRAKMFILDEFIKITSESLSDAMLQVGNYEGACNSLATSRDTVGDLLVFNHSKLNCGSKQIYGASANTLFTKDSLKETGHRSKSKGCKSSHEEALLSTFESKLKRRIVQSYQEAHEELAGGKFCIPYFTCAVDTENIKRVFKACSHILKKEHLEKSGLL